MFFNKLGCEYEKVCNFTVFNEGAKVWVNPAFANGIRARLCTFIKYRNLLLLHIFIILLPKNAENICRRIVSTRG